ncbi:hypothetical protein E1283_03465 [Streptomyces hainanensis]|uniref:Uncharacterized protein n=1 Tax=Streptomyces hainanensis TaxID=402648 RepID=A0A4V2Y458_9ACTN|nr:hypothetical protein E1283_03465 [Streptomyces hainanensis]
MRAFTVTTLSPIFPADCAVSDAEIAAVPLTHHAPPRRWNYVLHPSPRQQPADAAQGHPFDLLRRRVLRGRLTALSRRAPKSQFFLAAVTGGRPAVILNTETTGTFALNERGSSHNRTKDETPPPAGGPRRPAPEASGAGSGPRACGGVSWARCRTCR